MSKKKVIKETTEQVVENVDKVLEKTQEEAVQTPTVEVKAVEPTSEATVAEVKKEEQAVKNAEKVAKENAKKAEKNTASESSEAKHSVTKEQVVVKKGGTGIALLALLVALGVGGAGYYFGLQKFTQVENQIQAIAQKANQITSQTTSSAATTAPVQAVNFDKEKAQLAELETAYGKAKSQIDFLLQEQSAYTNQIVALQAQVQRLSNAASQVDTASWLLSDANFLLNNALRKLVIDGDVDTAKNLLTEADNALSKVVNPQVALVRNALKADLISLNGVNKIDQNGLMQRLTALANSLDDLPMIDNETGEQVQTSTEVSSSVEDWQQNLEKSASSFLDYFIRVSDKNKADDKAFIAPNQEVYLRENIRLRLQIAILAVPRQQNELYQTSLEAVSTWIRSYFDNENENVRNFLKTLDELGEQSIYIDVPEKLQSLILLDEMLKKAPQKVEKIEIKEEKALISPTAQPEAKATDAKTADIKATEEKAEEKSESQAVSTEAISTEEAPANTAETAQ